MQSEKIRGASRLSRFAPSRSAASPVADRPYMRSTLPFAGRSLRSRNIRTLTSSRLIHEPANRYALAQPGVCLPTTLYVTILPSLYIDVFGVGFVVLLFIFFDGHFLLLKGYPWC